MTTDTDIRKMVRDGHTPTDVMREILKKNSNRMYLFEEVKRIFRIPLKQVVKIGGWRYWEDGQYTDEEMNVEFQDIFMQSVKVDGDDES